MLRSVRRLAPEARIDGFIVQEMIDRRHDARADRRHRRGRRPSARSSLFGQGGVAVEVIADRAIGLPPLNIVLAREMISRTRVARLLHGYRDRPPADIDAIAAPLVRLSELLVDAAGDRRARHQPAAGRSRRRAGARRPRGGPGAGPGAPAAARDPALSGRARAHRRDRRRAQAARAADPAGGRAAPRRDGRPLVAGRRPAALPRAAEGVSRTSSPRGCRRSTTTARWRWSRSTTRRAGPR